jgi:hypothetical protein
MLSNTLNTNEIKNAAGTEIEFSRLSTSERQTVFAQVTELPAQPHRLVISHQESGSGLSKRRRSLVRFDKTVISGVDATLSITISAYAVLDLPVGAMSAITEGTNALAELMSFLATTGAATTVLFDGTGNGASAMLTGGL